MARGACNTLNPTSTYLSVRPRPLNFLDLALIACSPRRPRAGVLPLNPSQPTCPAPVLLFFPSFTFATLACIVPHPPKVHGAYTYPTHPRSYHVVHVFKLGRSGAQAPVDRAEDQLPSPRMYFHLLLLLLLVRCGMCAISGDLVHRFRPIGAQDQLPNLLEMLLQSHPVRNGDRALSSVEERGLGRVSGLGERGGVKASLSALRCAYFSFSSRPRV
jgi:hypothetical protein